MTGAMFVFCATLWYDEMLLVAPIKYPCVLSLSLSRLYHEAQYFEMNVAYHKRGTIIGLKCQSWIEWHCFVVKKYNIILNLSMCDNFLHIIFVICGMTFHRNYFYGQFNFFYFHFTRALLLSPPIFFVLSFSLFLFPLFLFIYLSLSLFYSFFFDFFAISCINT